LDSSRQSRLMAAGLLERTRRPSIAATSHALEPPSRLSQTVGQPRCRCRHRTGRRRRRTGRGLSRRGVNGSVQTADIGAAPGLLAHSNLGWFASPALTVACIPIVFFIMTSAGIPPTGPKRPQHGHTRFVWRDSSQVGSALHLKTLPCTGRRALQPIRPLRWSCVYQPWALTGRERSEVWRLGIMTPLRTVQRKTCKHQRATVCLLATVMRHSMYSTVLCLSR